MQNPAAVSSFFISVRVLTDGWIVRKQRMLKMSALSSAQMPVFWPGSPSEIGSIGCGWGASEGTAVEEDEPEELDWA